MDDPLIRTKLHLPSTRPTLVLRPRLQAQMAQGLHCPLTLVIAPAGFGKTSLVASCVVNCGIPVAWLSLDKGDNQAGRFLGYLVAALQEANPTIGSEAALLATAQQVPPEVNLINLINELDSATREFALVLDDYQFISNQAVHDAVTFLLEHCPPSLHLVIASRSDPPLPLARLRASGQIVELRAADLSFSEAEAAQFLNKVMGLSLDAGSVALLKERTEGWIAGLQMAALSLRNRTDIHSFIKAFSGTNRYILDYLLEEVLAIQTPEIQRFLLYTSVLERLNGPLCDALFAGDAYLQSKDDDSKGQRPLFPRGSTSSLEYLERANLFLVPLDDERIWYRYHHLLVDLLRARLDTLYPGLAPQLHGRAAAWLDQAGLTVEAVNHALAAGEYDRAAHLVEQNTSRLLAQGEMNAVTAWIEMLPPELRLARPWLCIHLATALMFAGRPLEVEPLLVQAESALEAGKVDPISMRTSDTQTLKGAMAAIRAFAAVTAGQDAEAFSQVQQARRYLTVEDMYFQSLVAWATGRIMITQGRLPEARLAFEEQIRLGWAMHLIWTWLAGCTYLAQVLQAQGQLQQARTVLEKALVDAAQEGARSRGFIAWVEDGLVSILYELNELEEACRLLAEAITLIHQWPNHHHLVYTQALLARVLLAQGDLSGARTAIGEADKIRTSAVLSRWLRRSVEADMIRVWLAFQVSGISLMPGEPLAEQSGAILASWQSELETLGENENMLMDECTEIAVLTLARVRLAAGRAGSVQALLEPITHSARTFGHTTTAIGSLVLTALVWQANPAGLASALKALENALCLAQPGGYIRIFLDQGQPMQMLLAQWLAHADSGPLREYAIHLLSQFGAGIKTVSAREEKVSPTSSVVEPLSQRELEVLHLMALGRTNPDIARQLIVAPGTVKAHAASIYRKLDVTNRTEAVDRARQLGILP
jgi:LuxR family transcriptional regulator, maltose regulon positive regulatory protein